MGKNQYELCIKVLKRFDKAGVLKDVILIGSWCIPFYKEYFAGIKYISTIIKYVFNSMLVKWQKKVIKGLQEAKEREIILILQNAGE